MSTLTLAELTPDTEEAENHPLDPTTVAYIGALVEPWAVEIREQGSIDDLADWAQHTLPASIMDSIGFNSKSDLATKQNDLIQIVGLSLSIPAIEYVEASEIDTVVLPWDVVDGVIDQEPETAQFFGFDEDDRGYTWLPVTVTVNRRRFTHQLTKLMAFGLVLFSRVAGFDFAPEMFGVPFSYFDDTENRHRYFEYAWTEGRTGYHINIAEKDYYFSSQDAVTHFVHGFSTGALWAGVDHHAYWSNFYYENFHGERLNLTF